MWCNIERVGWYCLFTSALAAQNEWTVPAHLNQVDGPTQAQSAGFTTAQRMQVLVDSTQLTGMGPRSITGIWFRRDRSNPVALRAGLADVQIKASYTTTPVAAPSRVFDDNHGASTWVFRGRVSLPASPIPTGSGQQVLWSLENTIRIPFQTTLGYGGQQSNLCVDLCGAPVHGASAIDWPLDHDSAVAPGSVSRSGTACGAHVVTGRKSISADPWSLWIGGTAVIRGWSEARASGLLAIGIQVFQPPVELSFLGAPGCYLHVQPIITLPKVFSAEVEPGFPGGAEFHLPIPPHQAFLGATLFGQWLSYGTRLNMSEALRLQLAALPPALGMTTVTSPASSELSVPRLGKVDHSAAPILRLILQ